MSTNTITRTAPRISGPFLGVQEMAAHAGEVPSLDGLRAVSIGLVLCSHLITEKIPGGLGVYVFFVVSGFLITRLLLAEQKRSGRINLPKFYARRFLRLYPVLIVYTVLVVATFAIRGQPILWMQPLSALGYFANFMYWNDPIGVMPFDIAWSLSVEEHFYALFPATLILLRCDPKKLVVAMVAVMIACLGARIIVAAAHPELLGTHFFYFLTPFRLDSMAFGVAAAALCEIPQGRALLQRAAEPLPVAAAGAVVLACLFFRDPFFRETLRYTLLGGALAVLMMSVLLRGDWRSALLNSPALIWIGRLSYSLYLWHFLARPITTDLPIEGPARIALQFALTFSMAAASYYFVERPVLRWRKRFGSAAR